LSVRAARRVPDNPLTHASFSAVNFSEETEDDSDDDNDDGDDDEEMTPAAMKLENERMLRSIVEQAGGTLVPVKSAVDIIGACKKRSVNQVTKFRGSLHLGGLELETW
jgi:hypothetical protein